MASNVNLTISSEANGTTRDNVPDWLVHMSATWIGNDGQPHSYTEDRYFLLQLNWLKTNHPDYARRLMELLTYRIERVRVGIDEVNGL